jgi:hypothetical protein
LEVETGIGKVWCYFWIWQIKNIFPFGLEKIYLFSLFIFILNAIINSNIFYFHISFVSNIQKWDDHISWPIEYVYALKSNSNNYFTFDFKSKIFCYENQYL